METVARSDLAADDLYPAFVSPSGRPTPKLEVKAPRKWSFSNGLKLDSGMGRDGRVNLRVARWGSLALSIWSTVTRGWTRMATRWWRSSGGAVRDVPVEAENCVDQGLVAAVRGGSQARGRAQAVGRSADLQGAGAAGAVQSVG